MPAGPAAFVRKEDILQWIPDFSAFVQRFAARERYDIVHAHFYMSGLVAMELKSALGLPFVISGVLKSVYDVTLWRWFRPVPLPDPAKEPV